MVTPPGGLDRWTTTARATIVRRLRFALCLAGAIPYCALGLVACGGSGSRTRKPSLSSSSIVRSPRESTPVLRPRLSSSGPYARGDDDTDDDDSGNEYQRDDYPVRGYGRVVGNAQRRTVAVVVKRYFRAAAAGDGVATCSLLSSSLAKRRDLSAAIPADYASPPTAALHGKACVPFMAGLLRLSRQQIAAANVATMVVTSVRVRGRVALALLAFRVAKERQIPLVLEHGIWKIDALLDLPIP